MKRKKDVGMSPSERTNLPERVAHFYYSHGLLCSSHPILVLFFAISIILLCSYPLINLPLPGDTPIQTITDSNNFTIPDNLTVFSGKPAIYIQQIVIKTGVSPWPKEMTVCDAFRAPLYQVFPLLETIRNFQPENSSKSLSNLCLHVESVKLKSSEERKKLLPEYNCLMLSPANFWQQNENNFQMDTNLMGTIFNYHNFQKGKISLTEILFGVNMKESGLKRHPLRSRPRIIQYAVTLVLEEFDEWYISGLRKRLEHQFPLYASSSESQNNSKPLWSSDKALHVFYPGEFNFYELLPLGTVFVLLFIYIYFSLRKIEPVKSKLGIAFSAVISILSCLCMSMGLCFFFGLSVSFNGKEIFPYLVVFVGLENVLVITKSITNTPTHLDVKIRVAQGLSREGWSITKNLLIQVTILTIGFSTFVSAIQQLCILGIVGLVCDFFLQLLFFTTILSIDIHRMESNFDNKNNYYYYHSLPVQKVLTSNKFGTTPYDKPYLRYFNNENKNLVRSKSHHNLTSNVTPTISQSASYPTNVLAQSAPILNKIPKRLKLVNIWASTRFFQRAFMIALVMWMCFILYTAKFVQQVLQIDEMARFHQKLQVASNFQKPATSSIMDSVNDLKTFSALMSDDSSTHSKQDGEQFESDDSDLSRFRHPDQDSHRRLSLYHWPVLMSLYNISLTGKFITILPSIRISHTVSPESAIAMRNPNEKMANFQWKSLAVALDPLDFTTSDVTKASSLLTETSDSPFIPRSPMEIVLLCILVGVSVFVLAYMTMVLYRCICSRNYAEWRSSWSSSSTHQDSDTQVVLEAVPTTLEGHFQEIECLISGGLYIISSCLLGEIRVWNSSDGELVTHINRQKYFSSAKNSSEFLTTESDHLSDYESGSPPSVGEVDISSYQVKTSNRGISNDSSVHNLVSSVFNERGVYNRKKQKSDISVKPNLNFSKLKLHEQNGDPSKYKNGFDFETPLKMLAMEKRNSSIEELVGSSEKSVFLVNGTCERLENQGITSGNGDNWNSLVNSTLVAELCANDERGIGKNSVTPIWCIDCLDNLIAVGCSNGQIEFWECLTGKLQCSFDDGNHVGVTSIKLCDNKVIVARLNGSLDLLQLDSQNRRQSDWGFTSNRRTHVRTGSAGSAVVWDKRSENVRCRKLNTFKAHQQPITVLECESGRIVTGSQDHTLKVFRLEDISLQYTLHGHCGPITCMFIDKVVPFLSGSGSHDGLLCFWDLLTGACLYSIQAHDGSICALTYSASYVISLGTDDRICVWERFLGHLLNTIQVIHTFCTSMVMLTHNLLITSKQGSLVMWDVRTGEPVRIVRLGNSDQSVFVKQILNLGDSVVCDYGSQLRIVKFPIITDKTE